MRRILSFLLPFGWIILGLVGFVVVPGEFELRVLVSVLVASSSAMMFRDWGAIIKEYERGGIFFLGRLISRRGPGPVFVWPWETLYIDDTRQRRAPIPVQAATAFGGLNLPFELDVEVFFRLKDPVGFFLAVHQPAESALEKTLVQMTQGAAMVALDQIGAGLFESGHVITELQQIMKTNLSTSLESLGISIDKVEITRLTPPVAIQQASNQRTEAEGYAQAERTRAEAEAYRAEQLRKAYGKDWLANETLDTLKDIFDRVQKSGLKVLGLGGSLRDLFTTTMPVEEDADD